LAALSYPALLDEATQTLYPLRTASSFLVGRNETADLCVLDPTCSRHHFRILRVDGEYHVEPLAASNPTFCDGRPVNGRQPLEHEAVLQAGQSRFRFLARPRPAAGSAVRSPSPRAADDVQRTVMAAPGQLGAALLEHAFPLSGTVRIGRQQDAVELHLPHPQVSRLHARIDCRDGAALLDDLGSANGTFVNGRRIEATTPLEPGDHVDVGPYSFRFTGTALVPRSRADNVELVATNLRRVVTDRATGEPLTLLDDVTLVVRPREFVCLLGPSGSGKSTLLSALSGRVPADDGTVLLNGLDLAANFDAVKQDMVVVPQKDVVLESLSVGRSLWYTARLRLPPDTSPAEIEAALVELLDTVGLAHCRATRIRHLSGGQLKRASLANEILCKPSLLFLDEVTSGLDEQTDREMMDLFRSLADAGKTVVCITHSLANVERTCHLVVILAPGGRVAFVGKPAEALQYFRIDRLGDVYDRLADHPPEHWQRVFLSSAQYRRYVAERLPEPSSEPAPAATGGAKGHAGPLTFLRQASLLTQRYLAVWLGDWPALAVMTGQALLIAVLLCLVFGDLDRLTNPVEQAGRASSLLFLLAVSSFWFGCNNAAKEIVKERGLYVRERDFNLLPVSYYASKLLLLTLFSSLQVVALYATVRLWCGVPGPVLVEQAVLLAMALAGVTLGLVISAVSASEEMAVTLIPLAVIPQIVLSGVIVPVEGGSKALALAVIATYWGKRGMDACLPESIARAIGLEQHSAGAAVAVLLGHAAAGVIVALVLLHWRALIDRFAKR
jgi:ABC-type multidrug transport system ATPase subunit